MNKILYAFALASVLGLSSCSDFLDQKSPSEMTADNTYASIYYTGLRINKLYGGMGQDRTYGQDFAILTGMNTDCELVDGLGSNATDRTSERGNMNYNTDPGWSKLADEWNAMYGIIEDANQIIEGIKKSERFTEGGSNQKAMERYLGEALTIRAMVYFDLIRYFGDVPFKTESSKADLSNAYLEKTDRDVIMDALMDDLDQAIEYLPWADKVADYTTEHVTKGYAHALLAQIAMTRAGFVIREKAKDGYETASYSDATYPTQRPGAAERKGLYERALSHWSAIITNGTHNLNPSFENEWYLLNQLVLDRTYHENIFEIPMGESSSSELGITVGVRLNGDTSEFGKYNSTGKMKVTAPLLYSFDAKDTRRDITCSNMEIKQDGSNTIESMLKNAPFGLYVGKWDVRKMNDTYLQNNKKLAGTRTKHNTGINLVKMRYSQVLLYYAECMNELAGSPDGIYEGAANGMTAREALAQVHTRAFNQEDKAAAQKYVNELSSDKDEFFKALVQENAWEFAGEGIRKWDLIRWNLLAEKINEFKETYLQELQDGTYQKTIYFNYKDEAKTKLDYSSITWYGLPEGKTAADYQGSIDSFGASKVGTGSDTQVDTNLPSISSGLVGDNVAVKNRYLMPIASTTISATNGKVHNSYGYAD